MAEKIVFNNNSNKIWSYLKNNSNYTYQGIAGLMGNLFAESSFYSDLCQGYTGNRSFCIEYTNKVNNKIYSKQDFVNFTTNGGGYGLAQWTYKSRKRQLYESTVEKGYSIGDINKQLEYLLYEIQYDRGSVPSSEVYTTLTNPNATLKECSDVVLYKFESPSNPDNKEAVRLDYSQQCYDYYKNGSISSSVDTQMINKINNFIEIAIREKNAGITEYPPNSNNVKYNTWYYGRSVNGVDYPWCMAFVQWCLNQAGIDVYKTASCTSFMNQYASCRVDRNFLQPGDIILFSNSSIYSKEANHVGIVIGKDETNNAYFTIEGNTSRGKGSQDNGGAVAQKVRYLNKNTLGQGGGIICGIRLLGQNIYGGNYQYVDSTKVSEWTAKSVDEIKDWLSGKFSVFDDISEGKSSPGFNEEANTKTGEAISPKQIQYREFDVKVLRESLKTVDADYTQKRLKSANLLTTPNFVESPFIILKVGKYTFGSYSKNQPDYSSGIEITYPNYLTSINVVKVNGVVNQYTIQMIYQIQAGQDPNMIDKIFSTVGYGTVYITYGDCSSPTFVYKTEEAIITNLISNVDFDNSRITYTLKCASNPIALLGGYYSFQTEQHSKPSDIISDILYRKNSVYGLLTMFPGMKNETLVRSKGLLKTDDQPVRIESKNGIDALSYINYLVSCMTDTADTSTGLRKSNYYLTICDDITGEFGGPYFKITKVTVDQDTIALDNSDMFEVDIGYPDNTLVMDFKIITNNAWNLLYNYSEDVLPETYMYNIDNNGNYIINKSPSIMVSNNYGRVTETQRNWWTQMTQFPITAQLTVKGLVRPALLMTKLKINALFYGQRHSSSGIYVITKQEDRVDANGYRTVLSLTRVAGDLDVIQSKKSWTKQRIAIKDNTTLKINKQAELSDDAISTQKWLKGEYNLFSE